MCLQEEITMKNNQYGGIKGCSTTHLIIEVLQQICKNAEDYRSATVAKEIKLLTQFFEALIHAIELLVVL